MEIDAPFTDMTASEVNVNLERLIQPAKPTNNESLTIGCDEIKGRGGSDLIFKTYKPIQVVQYHATWKGWTVDHDFMTNAKAKGQADANIFTLKLYDCKTKELKYQKKEFVASKVQGRLRSALICLCQMFGSDKKW
eukprot:CAMPEP_0185582618 /NCGR_PEP_ID=MMETSP0434-20130131/21009_1 /TAXON_ID=626734 ORGANISM="Favella taraikaensis, Strain Fe Narragansett Bay" /NCGR_SAMPLE_ID=MMETSP0434 /ASSEMBLY_ACC=CAM_ASM_000379 /LENGTH=135 /DNA_ID=CAMNT_0028201485 /DNA_START=867 /DNA_END=1271 /DNA_ORIENTATION=-